MCIYKYIIPPVFFQNMCQYSTSRSLDEGLPSKGCSLKRKGSQQDREVAKEQ